MFHLFSYLILLLSCIGYTYATFQCSYTSPDGQYIYNDLGKLTRLSDFISTDDIFYYTLNICGFSNNKNCSGVYGSICTLTRDGMVIDAIGKYGAGKEPTWALTYESRPQAGVTLAFDNGQFEGKPTRVRLNLVCDLGALATGTNFTTIYTPEMFVMSLRTPYACPKYNGPAVAGTTTTPVTGETSDTNTIIVPGSALPVPISPSPSTPSPPPGLSGLAIFFILLIVFIPLYIGIGCFYKSQHLGTSGLESCPNYAFWQAVPKYVHDGCLYGYRRVAALFHREPAGVNREEYDGL